MDKIKITVKLFAQFREFLKKNKIEIEVEEGTNIFQLIESLCDLYDLREKIFDKKNEIKQQINILKNGRQIKFLEGTKTKLEHGDEISLFPPIMGG
ncbi:MAG: ubiquitin-like small modifier protein 1 [Promethearchaeota archaeon]